MALVRRQTCYISSPVALRRRLLNRHCPPQPRQRKQHLLPLPLLGGPGPGVLDLHPVIVILALTTENNWTFRQTDGLNGGDRIAFCNLKCHLT